MSKLAEQQAVVKESVFTIKHGRKNTVEAKTAVSCGIISGEVTAFAKEM